MPDDGAGFVYFRSGAERAAAAEAESEPEVVEDDKGKDKEPKAVETEAEAEAEVDDDDYPDDGTIPEVKDWVNDDPDRALAAYEREQERSTPRTTLLEYLDTFLVDEDNPDA